MAELYANTTTEGYDYYRNDSLNDSINGSVYDNSTTTSTLSSMRYKNLVLFIIYTAVIVPICVVGFIANIICYIILKTDSGKKHRTATFLLQALAVTDNMYLIFMCYVGIMNGLPLMLGEARYQYRIIKLYSVLYMIPFLHMSRFGSVWLTVIIATNRYIAVCRPFLAHRLASLKKTKIQVAVVVTLAFIAYLPRFLQYTIEYTVINESITRPYVIGTNFGPNTKPGMVYNILLGVIAKGILPLVLLISFNTRVMWELKKAAKSRVAVTQSGGRSDNSITLVMVVIVIVFIVCGLPHCIYVIVYYAGHRSGAVYSVSDIIVTLSSSTNFIVYYVLRASFRSAFTRYFATMRQRCCWCRTTTVNTTGIAGNDTPENGDQNVENMVDINSP